jgi:putative flippase GtrA
VFGSVHSCFAHTRKSGDQDVTNRIVIMTALISMAVAASAVAVNILQVPDPSMYVLFAAGIVALVMLRRRAV